MKRSKRLLIPPVLAVTVALAAAAPAFAGKGGDPAPGSCGLGKGGAHDAIADTTSPGATETPSSRPPSRVVRATARGRH